MSITVNGTSGLTFNDASTQASSQVGMKNRMINGGFILNQRGYVSGAALASGAYGHDRFKGGASGGTYTYTQGSLGVNTTITITAGSMIQIIEGCNVAEGGTYVLSWTGTAQGRLNAGTYGSSGTVVISGWTPGTNLPVEFNTGTVGNIQLEKGSTATTFDYRPYGTELALCQRYYWQSISIGSGTLLVDINSVIAGQQLVSVPVAVLPVPMRTTPTINVPTGTWSNGSGGFAFALGFVIPTSNTSGSGRVYYQTSVIGTIFTSGAEL